MPRRRCTGRHHPADDQLHLAGHAPAPVCPPPENVPAGPIHEQVTDAGLNLLEVPGHHLPEPVGVPERLRLDALDRLLGLFHEGIQFGARPDVQPPEPLEELPKVLDGGIPEDLGLAVVQARQPFSEMGREPLEFRGESLLGQLDGILEPLTDPGLLLLVDLRVQGHEVARRLDGRVGDFEIEQAVERAGVVAGLKSVPSRRWASALDLVVLAGEFPGGLLEPSRGTSASCWRTCRASSAEAAECQPRGTAA